jgi:hypothetical protein
VRPHTKALALALPLAAIMVFFAAHILSNPEPTYHGQPLSYWIDLNRHLDWGGKVFGEQERDLNEAHAAITTIGTNGLPYLSRWIGYRPPLWETNFMPWAPRFLRRKVDHFNQDRADRAQAAWQALEVLGTNAVSAIPDLAALAMKTNILDRGIARRATRTLSYLGPQAYPALMNVWSNAGPGEKSSLLYWRIRNLLTNTPAQ